MRRNLVWTQLLIGWLPVGALYALLVYINHGTGVHEALFSAFTAVIAAGLLGLLAQRVIDHMPWPRPINARFMLRHAGLALVYAAAWLVLNSLLQTVLHGHSPIVVVAAPAGIVSALVLGIWLYVMVAGVSYAARATERAAAAEATLARSRLAGLRAQLNPHFLFNALHTVVHLIPAEPGRAAQAAEELAGMLRTSIEEDRDLVSLKDEIAFVQRYLELERIRFGDRLRVSQSVPADAGDVQVPSFALQTLVENAVRHGASPKVDPTDIVIAATLTATTVTLSVDDTGQGATEAPAGGSGLQRLRERIAVLYGGAARLEAEPRPAGGFRAALVLPRAQP